MIRWVCPACGTVQVAHRAAAVFHTCKLGHRKSRVTFFTHDTVDEREPEA